MVTIVKGNQKIVCTKGTFEEQYKQLGYRLASKDEKEATNKVASILKVEKEANEDEAEKDELTSKYGLKSSKKSTTSKKEDK